MPSCSSRSTQKAELVSQVYVKHPDIVLRGTLTPGGGSVSHRLSLPSQSQAHSLGPIVAPGPSTTSTRTLTLSSALSRTFKLLSEDVTSGPKSTLPLRAEGVVLRTSREAFPLLPFPELPLKVPKLSGSQQPVQSLRLSHKPRPLREAPGAEEPVHLAKTPLTTLNAEGVIHQALVNHLGAKGRHEVHV